MQHAFRNLPHGAKKKKKSYNIIKKVMQYKKLAALS